jgi:hypothetical protein
MKPQVGDIVQVKEEHMAHCGLHMGLITRLIKWPDDALVDSTDWVILQDPNLINPVQLQTRFVEVISRA